MNAPISHTFSRSDIRLAAHLFEKEIKKIFGDIWKLKSDTECIGKSWDCRSMIAVDPGLWRLCQAARHAGATRAAPKLETRDGGTCLRFIIFYNPSKEKSELII